MRRTRHVVPRRAGPLLVASSLPGSVRSCVGRGCSSAARCATGPSAAAAAVPDTAVAGDVDPRCVRSWVWCWSCPGVRLLRSHPRWLLHPLHHLVRSGMDYRQARGIVVLGDVLVRFSLQLLLVLPLRSRDVSISISMSRSVRGRGAGGGARSRGVGSSRGGSTSGGVQSMRTVVL